LVPRALKNYKVLIRPSLSQSRVRVVHERNPILPGAAGLILTENYLFKLGAKVNGTRLQVLVSGEEDFERGVLRSFTHLANHVTHKHTHTPLQIAEDRAKSFGDEFFSSRA
jgi:hypothetical protein